MDDNVVNFPGAGDTPEPALGEIVDATPEQASAERDPNQLDLNDLESYVVVGRTKDGRRAKAVSANMTLDDLADYVAQVQLLLDMEVTQAGMMRYMAMREMEQRNRRVITPGRIQ